MWNLHEIRLIKPAFPDAKLCTLRIFILTIMWNRSGRISKDTPSDSNEWLVSDFAAEDLVTGVRCDVNGMNEFSAGSCRAHHSTCELF